MIGRTMKTYRTIKIFLPDNSLETLESDSESVVNIGDVGNEEIIDFV